MNEERIVQNLAAAARGETPPAVDVAGAVMASLGRMDARPNRLIVWFAAVSSAAAIVLVALALGAVSGGGVDEVADMADIGMMGML